MWFLFLLFALAQSIGSDPVGSDPPSSSPPTFASAPTGVSMNGASPVASPCDPTFAPGTGPPSPPTSAPPPTPTAPTNAPGTGPPTSAPPPTPTAPTNAPGSGAPTLGAPTPGAPTFAPGSNPPTVPAPTPTRAPTRAPTPLAKNLTFAPGSAPPTVPTPAPTAPTGTPTGRSTAPPAMGLPTPQPTTPPPTCCSIEVHPGGPGGAQTVELGGPGDAVVVTVPQSPLPNNNGTNTTVSISVTGIDPTTTKNPGGTKTVTITISVGGEPLTGTVPLAQPIKFSVPLHPDVAKSCNPQLQCVWWDGGSGTWVTSGCQAQLNLANSTTDCTCDHLTTFAVLLEEDQGGALSCEPSEVYQPFIAVYCLLLLYCIVATIRLLRAATSKDRLSSLLWQHGVVGVISALHILSALRTMGVFGVNPVARGIITALPYPFEFWTFTKLASTWASITHYAMLHGDARWAKIRPAYWCLNLLGAGATIGLFSAFIVDSSRGVGIAGTVILAATYVGLAIAFHIYSGRMFGQLEVAAHSRSSSKPAVAHGCCASVGDKVKWAGIVTSVSFCLQAVSMIWVLFLTSMPAKIFWTVMLLFSNCCALIAILVLYHAAYVKATSGRKPLEPNGGGSRSNLSTPKASSTPSSAALHELARQEGEPDGEKASTDSSS